MKFFRFALACGYFLTGLPAGAQNSVSIKLQNVTVRPGDTLWGIANNYLKDPTRWNEILKYNQLPSSDPTIALPGMVLKIPIALIKESMRAAALVYRTNQVLFRKRDRADWGDAELGMQLYRDDSLRTLAASRARVQFINGDLLSLDENSMAILRPKAKPYDLELLRGAIQATRSKVITASASITPKTRNTSYSAKVREDLSTRVEVYKGAAEVEGGGASVEVRAGFATDVQAGSTPSPPSKMPELPKFEARIGEAGEVTSVRAGAGVGAGGPARIASNTGEFGLDLKSLQVGIPVAAYRIQAAHSPEFDRIVFDRVYDVDENIDLSRSGLPAGRYWWRVAAMDLLGSPGKFSTPKEYDLGMSAAPKPAESFTGHFEVIRPPTAGDQVGVPEYRVTGSADRQLTVAINGTKIPIDDVGNFAADVSLQKGVNRLRISATDTHGNSRETIRKVEFQP